MWKLTLVYGILQVSGFMHGGKGMERMWPMLGGSHIYNTSRFSHLVFTIQLSIFSLIKIEINNSLINNLLTLLIQKLLFL
jgi:hypothetical protein